MKKSLIGKITLFAAGAALLLASCDIAGDTATKNVEKPKPNPVEPSGGDLIGNGTFTTDGSGWSSWSGDGGSAVVTYTDGTATINVSAIGSQWWNVQFWQENISVANPGTYTLSIKAKANTPRDMRVEFVGTDLAVSPNHLDFALNDTLTEYQATVNLSAFGSSPKIKLNMGFGKISTESQNATITLDDISVIAQETALETDTLTVNVSSSGAPVAGATVTLTGGLTQTSDADGKAVFTVEPRQYAVSVTKDSYIGYSSIAKINGNQTIDAAITLAAPESDAYLYRSTGTIDVSHGWDNWGTGTPYNDGCTTEIYNPCISLDVVGNIWSSGTKGFALAFTNYSAGAAVGFTNLKFKMKSTTMADIKVKFPGATTEQLPFVLADVSTSLGNGWSEVTIPLAGFGNLGSNGEMAVLNTGIDLAVGSVIYITDVYFDVP